MVLVVALIAVLVLAIVGAALLAVTLSETMVAANHRAAIEARNAADTAMALAITDLPTDAGALLSGLVHGTLWDGPGSERTLVDGSVVDLDYIRNRANCGAESSCSPGDLASNQSGDRPWGVNNPLWQLFAHAPLAQLSLLTRHSPFYVVVMVADDPMETDGDPTVDAAPSNAPGAGVVLVRAEAFGPRGAHASVDAVVRLASAGGDPIRLLGVRPPTRLR
jgi:hypothetical protein